MKKTLLTMALAGYALAAGSQALAAEFPSKSITMLVPFAAGGPTDTVARLMAQSMSKTLGQQVVVENAPGAGGTVAPGKVARAEADGHTILIHHISMAVLPTLYRKLSFDVTKDFEPVARVVDVPQSFVARKDFPPNSMPELISYVKANKDKLNMANAGVGSGSHLCGMLFMSSLNTEVTTVPYKGTGPAMNDLLAGQVDFMCDQTTNTTSQIKAGSVKGYAVTSKTKVASLPNLPTVASAGIPNFEMTIWHGFWAPKGTPKAAIDKLAKATQVALNDPLVKQRFADLGARGVTAAEATPGGLRSHHNAEITKWQAIIKRAGVYAD